MAQEPQTMQEYKTQRETDWNAYKSIHGILDPGYLTRTDYMDKYDRDHTTVIANIKSRQNGQNAPSQNKQSENKSENRHDDSDMQGSDHSKNQHTRRRRNKRSKNKQSTEHNSESLNQAENHKESASAKTNSQKSDEKGDKKDDKKAGENKKPDNSEKSQKKLDAEKSKAEDKKESKQVAKLESNDSKKNDDASESEELSAQSSTMLDNDQAEVSSKSLGSMIRHNKKQNKQDNNSKVSLAKLDKKRKNKADESKSGNSYLRKFPTEVRDYAIKKVAEMARSDGFTGDRELIAKLYKNKTNLVVIYIMSQMDDEYFNNCSNRVDISDQLIEAAKAVRSFKKSQEKAKKPPIARDAKRAKEYSRDTYYLAEEILRLLALQFGTTKMRFQAGETKVAEGCISEMNKINFNEKFVKSMMVALQRQTQADLEKARLRKGSNSITTTEDYDELI